MTTKAPGLLRYPGLSSDESAETPRAAERHSRPDTRAKRRAKNAGTQDTRDFIDALRECLGKDPLYYKGARLPQSLFGTELPDPAIPESGHRGKGWWPKS